jgi:hypothetical protein
MNAYERQADEMADGGYTPMGEVRIQEMYSCERHAYEIAYGRDTPMGDAPMRRPPIRGTPIRWPMRDVRL